MRHKSRLRQVALVVAGVCAFAGVSVGFWPVSAPVVGGTSYSCGSGFVHSRNSWKVDSRDLTGLDAAVGTSNATPSTACPARVYQDRDLAYALIGVAAAVYLALLASSAFDPAATPVSTRRRRPHRTTLVPSAHRSSARI